MWATQRALKFKVLQSGSEWKWEKKKLDKPQRRLCVLAIGSAREGFSWKTVRDWLQSEGERREFLEGWGEMWITASERKKSAKVCWGPSLWQHHGPFSGSAALRPQREDFFICLFNFMPCRPQNGPIPSPKLPCPPFVVGYPNPLPKNA